jgi:glycosyltransferase involved in cell wall biosynthesis
VNAFYRLNGKRVVFTAHNVNAKKRDGADTRANRLTLKAMYSRLDHIFVHTESAKEELMFEYGVVPDKITVIPFGLNTFVPDTPLSKREARAHLGLDADERVLLFFGQIAPYKGLDVLLDAFALLADQEKNVRLVVAGRPKRGCEPYWRTLAASLELHPRRSRLTVTDDFIPDAEVAIFFRAADVLVLPYRAIYQSGPLSLAYRFGVPVIATRIGCFNRDVVPGVTGLLCEPANPHDLARSIRDYFGGPLHRNAEQTRQRIRQIGHETYGWDGIGRSIGEVYARLEKGDTVAC